MCTALSIKSNENHHFFGRNMDLAYQFNQSILFVPRNYELENKVTQTKVKMKHAILGIGTLINNHPAMADAMNEKGLACAGLNFPGYAYYPPKPVEGKINIPPYDFVGWVLSNYETVADVKAALKNVEIVDIPLNVQTPNATLHWMISDKTGDSIVVERTKEKLAVHDNPVGVLTNNPTFDWHLTNLNEYLYLTPNHVTDTLWSDYTLTPLGSGAGTLGIPGDFASVSRFVRSAYIRAHLPALYDDVTAVTQFFHMLDYVAMVKGGVITSDGLEDLTMYSSCMNLESQIYYYKTYQNNRISAINMQKEDLDGKQIKVYPYLMQQDINFLN